MSKKGQRQRRRLHASTPPSGRKPVMNVAPRDVEAMAEELVTYHTLFHDLFQRREQREWSAFYLRGQLSDLERKTVEPLVLAVYGPNQAAVRAGQQFLGQGAWDDTAMMVRHQRLVAQSLGEPDGVVIFDGSGFPKQGTHSVGVARQYCGAVGKIANCQHGVFAVYVSRKGYTFVDRRLYMPQLWFDTAHAPLRQRYGVPDELTFQTEPQLALEMVRGLVERGDLPCAWVVADEHYGMSPSFLDGVEAVGKWYCAEVPASTQVWVGAPQVEPPAPGPRGRPRKHPRAAAGEPQAQEVHQIAAQLPPGSWQPYTIKEGSKGPIEASFAFVRVTWARRGRPGAPAWLVLRRHTATPDELHLFSVECPCDLCARGIGAGQWAALASGDGPGRSQRGVGHGPLRDPDVAGVASPYDADLSGAPFFGAHAAESKKKAPALTVPQARSLLTVALREHVLDLERAMDIVRYHQVRN